ncbi:hypothetical protein QBC38DRAFT_485415 [Podospora fimiseda]|uniref:Uncharacterized protein n=1 Tax=Podospora fimiseda TaxID=252190 RepID=A0AAN7BJM2_9PEZI|nr:hypothetical protein QBC38DRAFT_485415 [Podospora fimiseda]
METPYNLQLQLFGEPVEKPRSLADLLGSRASDSEPKIEQRFKHAISDPVAYPRDPSSHEKRETIHHAYSVLKHRAKDMTKRRKELGPALARWLNDSSSTGLINQGKTGTYSLTEDVRIAYSAPSRAQLRNLSTSLKVKDRKYRPRKRVLADCNYIPFKSSPLTSGLGRAPIPMTRPTPGTSSSSLHTPALGLYSLRPFSFTPHGEKRIVEMDADYRRWEKRIQYVVRPSHRRESKRSRSHRQKEDPDKSIERENKRKKREMKKQQKQQEKGKEDTGDLVLAVDPALIPTVEEGGEMQMSFEFEPGTRTLPS